MDNDVAPNCQGQPIVEAGGFQGYCEDFEYAWRWEIHRDGVVVHHGAALSEPAAKRAIESMIRVFGIMAEQNRDADPDKHDL